MRTTLTLEPDVARRLTSEMRRSGKTLKAAVNDALRSGLGLGGKRAKAPPFLVQPHAFGFKPGVDLDRINQLVDELDAEAAAAKVRR